MVSVQDKEEVKFFLDELNENLVYLDEAIITLEENPSDAETIEEIFRVAHTIKGSAGFLDLKNLVSLGHAMESVFQEFKDGKIQVNTEVITTVLECKDAIGEIGKLLGQGENTETVDTEALIQKINTFLHADSGKKSPAVKKADPISDNSKNGGELTASDYLPGTVLLRVWVSTEEPAPAIRAFLVQKNISEVAEIIKQKPTEEEMDSEDFVFPEHCELKFWVETDASDVTLSNAAKVDLIDDVKVVSEETLKSIAEKEKPSGSSDQKTGASTREEIELSDTVRIPVQRLDIMLNLVGELVIANSGFSQIQEHLRDSSGFDELYRNVRDRTKDLVRISADIQDLVMKSRLVPVSQVFNRFKRFIRDYSFRSGKKIQLVMTGESTEIDKKIIDEMIKPLTHLVRNSLDHGIESPEERRKSGKNPVGRLHLIASQEGNYINVVIEDDGKGLDYVKIVQTAVDREIITYSEAEQITEDEIKKLIFHPGFSTKEEIDEMSGRGVGMDVVKTSVEDLNGTIILDTTPGAGTRLTIKLPLTLAILNALIVRVAKDRFCIPMSSIVETQKVAMKNFLSVENNEMVRLRDSLIPIVRLEKIFPAEMLDVEGENGETSEVENESEYSGGIIQTQDELPVIVVDYHGSHVAILVDQFINRQEMVIKSLSEHYRSIEGISGASILGDGSIILIIDVHGVIQLHQKKRSKTFQDIGPGFGAGGDLTPPQIIQKPIKSPIVKPPKKTKAPEPAEPVTMANLSSMTAEQFESLEDAETNIPEEPESEDVNAQEEQRLEQSDDTAETPVVDDIDSDLKDQMIEDGTADELIEQVLEMNVLHTKIEGEVQDTSPLTLQDQKLREEEPEPIAEEPTEMEEPEAIAEDDGELSEFEKMKQMINASDEEPTEMEEPEPIAEDDGELSEFEKMKQMIDVSDEVFPDQNLALSHFDASTLDFSLINRILDGHDEENLKNWLKQANKRAIEGIISLTGREDIKSGKIRAKKFSQKKVMKHFDDLKMLQEEIIALKLPILPLSGMIYLIFTKKNALSVCNLLFETAQLPAPDELDYEPLLEVTNILGSAYTNTLTQITDIPVEPGLPEIIENREEVEKSLMDDLTKQKHRILFVENQFLWDNKSVLADILLMIPQIND
ncbi:MAG: chemotaxis protein CheW [Leptospirales bacterium]